jgi:hypothetical protein
MSELDRRAFISRTAQTCFGVSVSSAMAGLFNSPAFAATPSMKKAGGGKAKHVIYLFMSGGMTHIDTLDPKETAGTSIMGDTRAIGTNVAGIQLGHWLPQLSKQADKIAIIRSMNSTQGAHGPGRYFMRTGYTQRASIVHPTAGGWVNKLSEPLNQTLPSFVTVSCGNDHPGAGFMEPNLQPLPIGNPHEGLKNSVKSKRITEQDFKRQLEVRKMLDAQFDAKYHKGHKQVRAYNEVYDAAVKLMKSEDLTAFDLSNESQATHKLYGEANFSKGCLLARRLVERGVRSVEVELGGFDWHNDNFQQAETKLPILDQAVSALLIDLEAKGLLDSTLVVLATEFGRTPKVTNDGGRDHFPKAFSTMMAGGGIKGGFVYGETDATGTNVTTKKVSASDFNATIGHAMGINYDQTIYSASKRPFKMAGRKGEAITQLFG